jgi:hypothetical protein
VKAKCFEVLDRMTFIPVCAVNTEASCEGQRYLLRRAGYAADGHTVILTNLNSGHSKYDAYSWNSRTMRTAHAHIEQNFEALEDGAVIDVEFLLGETESPKTSEARS